MNNILLCALLGCTLALAACMARSPETQYYVLNAQPKTVAQQNLASAKMPVQIRRIIMPEYLDRKGIVSRNNDGVSLKVTDAHIWAEPLKTGLRRVLTEAMNTQLAHSAFVVEDAEDHNTPMAVQVEVLRFEGSLSGTAVLDARFSIEHINKGLLHREGRIFTENAGESMASMVQAQSRLAQHLGDAIAQALIKLPKP